MESLLSLTSIVSAGIAIWKTSELQKEIYGDLLKPGVAQVGKALESVLGFGNTVLIPLRIMNGSADLYEKAAFRKLADRLSKVPEAQIVSIPPEVGVPALDRLSYTKDENLQNMFVNLLASAASSERSQYAHPAFVKIIDFLSPDEAKILEFLAKNPWPGCVSIIRNSDDGIQILRSPLIAPPPECAFPQNISAYVSNLSGLGLVQIDEMRWKEDDKYYQDVFEYVQKDYPDVILGLDHGFSKENGIIAAKKIISMTDFGRIFLEGCIGECRVD